MPSSLLEINAVSDIQFDQAKISGKSEAGGAQGIVLAFPGCPSNCTEVVLSLEDFRGAGFKNSGREASNETLPAVGGHEGLGQVRARTSPVKSEPAIYSKKRTVPQTSQTTVYIGLVDEMVAATKHKIPEKRFRAQPLLTECSKRYSHKTPKRALGKNITKPSSEKINNEKAAGTNTRTDKRSELRIQPEEAATQSKWPRKPFSFQKTSPLSLSSGARQRNKPSEKRRENTLLICPVQRTGSAGGSCKQKTLELQNGDKPGIRIYHGKVNSSMDPRFGKHPEHVRIWRRSAEGDTRPKKRHEKVSNAGTCPDRKTKNMYASLIGEANTENKQEEGHAVISSGPSAGPHLLRANAPRSPLRLKLKGHRTIDKMFVDVMKILLTSGGCQEFTSVGGQEKNSDVCDSSRLTESSKERDDAAESTTNASNIWSSQSSLVNSDAKASNPLSSRAQDVYKVHELMTYSAHDDDDDDDDGDGDVFAPCFCSTLTYHNADPDSNNCHYRCGHDQDGRGTAWTSQRTGSLSDDSPGDSLNSNENSDSPADGVPETKEHESIGPGAGGASRPPSNTEPAISGPSTSKGQPEGRPPQHQQKISRAKYPVASDLHLSHFTASSPLEGLFEPINSGRKEEKCHGSSYFCPPGCSDNWAALNERSPGKGQNQEHAKNSTADIDCRARGSWDNVRTKSTEECERTDKDKEKFGSVSGGGSCKALKEHVLEALANSEQYRRISKPAGNAGPDWINSLSLQENESLKTTDLSSDTDKVLLLERSYDVINIAQGLKAVPTLEKKEGQVHEACQGIHDKVPLLFPGVSSQARKGCIAAAASCLGKARSVMSKARSRSLSPVSFVARIKNFFVSDSKTEAAANKSQSTPGVTSGFDTPRQASFDVSREADSGRKDEQTVEREDASRFQSISDQSSEILDDLPETGQKNVEDHASASQLTAGKSLQQEDQTTEPEGNLSPRECSETELDFKAALTGRHGREELQLATPTLTRLRSPFLESIAETDSISEESRSAEGDVEEIKETGLENSAGRDDFLEAFVASCCRKGAASNMAGSVDDGDHVGDCKMAAQISSSFTDFKRDLDDALSLQDDTSVSAPMKTHSLVNAGEVTQTESSVVEVMAIISQEVNIKRYPSFIDLTDLNDEGVFRVSKPSEQDSPVHNTGHEKSGQQTVHQHSSSPHQEVFRNSSLCDEISARRRRDSRSTQDWPVESPRKLNINSDSAENFPGVSFHSEKSESGVSDNKARSLSPDSWLSLTRGCTEENFSREVSVPNQNTILGKLRGNPPITFQQKITYRPHLFRGVFDIPSHVDRERTFIEPASDDFLLPSPRNDRSDIDEFPVDANSRYAHSEQRAPDVAGNSQVTATLKPSAELCQGKLILLRAAATGNSSPGSGISPGSGVVNGISDTSLNQVPQTSESHRSKAGASSDPQTTEERATCTAHPQNFSGKRRLTQASSVSYEEDDSLLKDAAAHAAMKSVGKCVFSQNISPGTSQDDPVELMQKNKNNFDDGCKIASTSILPRASSPSEVPGSSSDFSKDTAGEDFEEAPSRNMEQDAKPPCQGHLEAEASGRPCEMQANGASRPQTADNVAGDENTNSDSLREYSSREALKRDTLGCSTDAQDSSTGRIPGFTTSDNCNSCLSKTESEYSVPDNSGPDSDKHRLIQNEACTTHSAKSSRRDSLNRNDKDTSEKSKDSRMAAATNLTFLDKIFKSNKPKSFKFNTSAKKTCSCYSPCRRESRRGRTSSCHHFKRDTSAGSERGDETVVNPKALKVGSHLTITSVSTVFGAPDKNSSQSRRSVKRFVSTSAVCKHGVTADPAAKGPDVGNPGVFGVSGRRGASLQSLNRGLSNKSKASFSQSTSSTGTNEVTDESDFPVILDVAGSHHSSTDARHVFGSDLKVMQVEESSMDTLRETHELAGAASLFEPWADPAAEFPGLSQQEAANQNLASRLTWKLSSPSHEAKKSYDFASRSKPHLERCDQLIKRSAEIIRASREMIDSSQQQLESTAEKLSLTKPVRERLPNHNNITTD